MYRDASADLLSDDLDHHRQARFALGIECSQLLFIGHGAMLADARPRHNCLRCCLDRESCRRGGVAVSWLGEGASLGVGRG